MGMSFFYINAQRVISKILLVLIFVVLSSNSIADDNKPDSNDINHPATSVGKQSDVDVLSYFDDEENLAKLAEKISLNKEKRDALELLEKVDSFYSKSFYNLLLLIIAMISLVGVVIPFLITSYQTRLLKRQNISLQESIKNEVASRLSKLKQDLYFDNDNKILELKSNIKSNMERMEGEHNIAINKLRSECLARINNIKAGTCLINKSYNESAIFYFQAGLYYMQYESHYDLRYVIENLIRKVIPNMSSGDSDTEVIENYKKFLERLLSFNTELIYIDDIKELKSVWLEFLKRVENNDKK